MNTGWTPEPTQRQRLMNLGQQLTTEQIAGCVDESLGDLDVLESRMTFRARIEAHKRNTAAMDAERQASHLIGAPIRVSDERGKELADYFCDDNMGDRMNAEKATAFIFDTILTKKQWRSGEIVEFGDFRAKNIGGRIELFKTDKTGIIIALLTMDENGARWEVKRGITRQMIFDFLMKQ